MRLELERRAVMPLVAMARIPGKYGGRAPAITAFTATFSTVYSQYSRKCVDRMGRRAARGVRRGGGGGGGGGGWGGGAGGGGGGGGVLRNRRWRFSSVSGSTSLGVER